MNQRLPMLLIVAMLAGGCAQSKLAQLVRQEHQQARQDARTLTEDVARVVPPLHKPAQIVREYGAYAQPRVAEVVDGAKADLTYLYHAPAEAGRAFKQELDTVEPYLNNSIIHVRDWLTDQTVDAHEWLIGPVH